MDQASKIGAEVRPALASIFDSLQESGKRLVDVKKRLTASINKFELNDLVEAGKQEEKTPRAIGAIGDLRAFASDLQNLAYHLEQDMNRLEKII